jgi:hypothetical protein
MGWEQRGKNSYYYKKERDGAHVKSVYVGRGEVADMVAQLQSSASLIQRYARCMKPTQAVEEEKIELELDQLTDRVCVITEAALLIAGFHTHKRQWRKMRHA